MRIPASPSLNQIFEHLLVEGGKATLLTLVIYECVLLAWIGVVVATNIQTKVLGDQSMESWGVFWPLVENENNEKTTGKQEQQQY